MRSEDVVGACRNEINKEFGTRADGGGGGYTLTCGCKRWSLTEIDDSR